MSARHFLILANDALKAKAVRWIMAAPVGMRVEFKQPRRTLDQSARMWAMLGDIAKQKQHCGRYYDAADWKVIFLHALGRETRFVPALDGAGFLPIGQSSSDLSKAEMSELIELLFAWGAQNGIRWSDPTLIDERRAA